MFIDMLLVVFISLYIQPLLLWIACLYFGITIDDEEDEKIEN
ncbi:putative ORfan [Saudi moumouvirus]|uniref:Uncharacterized protein n=1 Tax=Moumouvirus sp. 'Monve' TaxID=1128131 RepID=H2EDA8_9VIRU|nr:hypothetical protein mv_L176 [Moumouvirus Monve]AQN68618.1 putative ORfan [Saudi moumouvirus]